MRNNAKHFFHMWKSSVHFIANGMKLLRARAERGDANAQSILGDVYHQGEMVAKDYMKAARWRRSRVLRECALSRNGSGD